MKDLTAKSIHVIGLMSGTSADGVDAALVRTNGESDYEFVDFISAPYSDEIRQSLIECARGNATEKTIGGVESVITEQHLNCVELLRSKNSQSIDLIGFHGHTIAHKPTAGITRQIGDGQRLADESGIPVVFDFRSADVHAGGQGAPLVPLFHDMLFRDAPKPAAVVNIGGVANITWLGAGDSRIIAGDTGPGCGLLDAWVHSQTGEPFDLDGAIAEQGAVHEAVVKSATAMPYFQDPLPKSADRFDFDSVNVSGLSVADGAATLCAVTSQTIADSIGKLGRPATTWITGGGSKHPLIMGLLAKELGEVRPIEDFGLRSDSMEAECFAWLAVRHLRGLPLTIPSTTGCNQPTTGGQLRRPVRGQQ